MFNNVLKDLLFYDFIYACDLDLNPNEVSASCEKIRNKEHVGVKRTNIGGWQSEPFGTSHRESPDQLMKQLEEQSTKFVNEVCKQELCSREVVGVNYWINFNSEGDHNLPHFHSDTHMVGVYYPRVPTGSGDIVLLRTDPGSVNSLYAEKPFALDFHITPVEGRLYVFPGHVMHYVMPSRSKHTRISVAYAFRCS